MPLASVLALRDLATPMAFACDCRSLLLLPCVNREFRCLFTPVAGSIRTARIWAWMESLDYPEHGGTLFWIQPTTRVYALYETDVFTSPVHQPARWAWRFQIVQDTVFVHDADLVFFTDHVRLRVWHENSHPHAAACLRLHTFHNIKTVAQLQAILASTKFHLQFQSKGHA